MMLELTIIENDPAIDLEILDNNNLISMEIEDNNTFDINLDLLEMDTIEELMVKPIFDVSYARRHPWLNI